MGLIVCPEMSVRNYHYTGRNSTEQLSSRYCQLLRLYGVIDIRMKMEHFWVYTEEKNRSTRIKTYPVPLFLNQIPHKLNWDCSWASTARGQRLTGLAITPT